MWEIPERWSFWEKEIARAWVRAAEHRQQMEKVLQGDLVMNDNPDTQVAIEMPQYLCHKTVRALKILELKVSPDNNSLCGILLFVVFEDERYAPRKVTLDWVHDHSPQPGGYFVQYADGYESYSPAAAFEAGYTRAYGMPSVAPANNAPNPIIIADGTTHGEFK